MNSFGQRILLNIRYLAIKPVLMLIGIQFLIFISIFMVPNSADYVVSNRQIFSGEIWRLITATFSHEHPWHIFSNMLFLFFFGRWFFETLSKKQLYIIIFGSGIFTNLLHICIDASPMIGFSGALYALLAATCTLDP
ncbi:MAG: rhomboid family intramembrane serine protease, partial [Planctomycetes bacterium]|nr:rhomboid family intramembrane serine protease [Planctomycetota bacterium]